MRMFEIVGLDSDIVLSIEPHEEPVGIKVVNTNRCFCGRFKARGKPCSLEVPVHDSWTGWEHL